jgi:hypothetical protein
VTQSKKKEALNAMMTLEVKDKKKNGKEELEGAKGDKGPCLGWAFYR